MRGFFGTWKSFLKPNQSRSSGFTGTVESESLLIVNPVSKRHKPCIVRLRLQQG